MPYLERKLMEDLIAWKNRSDRKPLVLKGARQVGKTRLLHEFGMREYADVATLNCDKSPAARTLFEQDFDMVRIIRGISAITGKEIQPEKTLIILDEIQEVPRALQSLKYFCEDAPNYHVCAAGSLLGIKIRGEYSYPVGKVHELTLYPMNFREFVHAIEGTTVYSALQQGKPEELSAIGDKWIELLRQYYYTGGMPEVVHSYITEKSLGKVRELQNQILHDYHDDISKHTD
ncbi:MAG: AAA family ATPase, partial [Clostridia bacterium]|nr:AAA family ATPase [Clostridia bacterium]